MAGLSEQEEFELLSLEREKARAGYQQKQGESRQPNIREAIISFLAPGGVSRMTNQASHDYNRLSYNAGGAVTDVAAKFLPPEGAAAVGTAANVGLQTLPMLGGGEAAKVATPALESGAKGLMNSALKPTWKAHKTGDAAKAVQTMLDEGINVTRGGMEKLQGKVDAIENAVQTALQGSNATVNKGAVASRIQDLIAKIDRSNPTPQQARAAAEAVYNDFVSNVLVPNQIPVARANEMKQTIYQAVRGKYGQMADPSVEAQKALARGFKEEIAAAVPDMSLLSKQGELINALNINERRVMMALNNNPGGLALLAKDPARMVAFLADKSSMFKSMIARMLYSGSEVIPETVGRIAAGAITYPNGQPPR